MIDVLQIHPDDNVCVALRPLAAGTSIECGGTSFVLEQAVPLGAKLALRSLPVGARIIKFGEPIGSLTANVEPGSHVHTHNLESDYLHTYDRGELVSAERRSES